MTCDAVSQLAVSTVSTVKSKVEQWLDTRPLEQRERDTEKVQARLAKRARFTPCLPQAALGFEPSTEEDDAALFAERTYATECRYAAAMRPRAERAAMRAEDALEGRLSAADGASEAGTDGASEAATDGASE